MDIIANDPGRGAGNWSGLRLPRWTRVAAFGGAVLSLVGYVATHRFAAPQDSSATWQAPARSVLAASTGANGTLTGRPGFGPLGLRLLFGGTNPRVVDLDTGGEHPIAGIPRTTGSSVVLSAVRGALLANVLENEPAGVYLVRPGKPAERLSAAGYALPSHDGTAAVIFEYRPHWRSMLVTNRSLDGRRQWQWRAPEPALPVRDTATGVLVQPLDPPGSLLLLRRETGQVVRRIAGTTVAVGDDAVVSAAPECRPRCTLIRTRLDTGATAKFTLPTDEAPDSGVMAPGGRWLALAFHAGVGESGTTVAVLDLHSGAFWPVPGVWAPEPVDRRRATLAWSADAQSLVVAVRGGHSAQVGVWRPDVPLEPVTVLPQRFAGAPLGLATLP
jgi:hypothetical protein